MSRSNVIKARKIKMNLGFQFKPNGELLEDPNQPGVEWKNWRARLQELGGWLWGITEGLFRRNHIGMVRINHREEKLSLCPRDWILKAKWLYPFCLKSSLSWLLFKQTSPQLFIKLQTIRSEIADQQEAHIRERQELEQAQEDLTRELKLKWVEPLPTSLWCLLRNCSWLLSPSQMRARVRLLALRPSRPKNLALNIWSDSNSSERRRVAESERELPRAYESDLERTRVIWSPWESPWAPEGLRPNDRGSLNLLGFSTTKIWADSNSSRVSESTQSFY